VVIGAINSLSGKAVEGRRQKPSMEKASGWNKDKMKIKAMLAGD
jgi:hypothetical protein